MANDATIRTSISTVTIFSLLYQHIVTKKDLFFAATLGLGLHFILCSKHDGFKYFDNRFQGMDRNPNTAGFKAAGLLMLSIYLLFYNVLAPKIRYPVAVFLGAMALIALLASGNRGSWVAIFVCFAILLLACFPEIKNGLNNINRHIAGCGICFDPIRWSSRPFGPAFRWLFCPPDRCLAKRPAALYSEALLVTGWMYATSY